MGWWVVSSPLSVVCGACSGLRAKGQNATLRGKDLVEETQVYIASRREANMSTDGSKLSLGFSTLYCEGGVFDSFSTLHPISFHRVLPFQAGDGIVDDAHLIRAEEAHLAQQNDATRQGVIDTYARSGLLTAADAENVKSVIDFYDADFFELMAESYANAGMFKCALRWLRESIARLETGQPPAVSSDTASVYADAGYCLYSLGLQAEAIAWSKSCLGPRGAGEAIARALIAYEAELVGGAIKAVERVGPRTRYTVSSWDLEKSNQLSPRLAAAMKATAPFQHISIDWIGAETTAPEIPPGGYPFQHEMDGGSLVRHKMNLIFSTCALADELTGRGNVMEARRVLAEAAILAPEAGVIRERLRAGG